MSLRCEERAGDLLPLLVERGRWRGLAGALVPAAGIHLVALDAVQIGMRPGALLVGLRLSTAMALVPVALGLPPQRLDGAAGAGRRRRAGERGFECVEFHLIPPEKPSAIIARFARLTRAGDRAGRASGNSRRPAAG